MQSAFTYAGQKRSAAARVLVHEAVHDTLVERLAGATEAMIVGQAEDFTAEVPPVIEREARDRVEHYARAALEHGRLVGAAAIAADGGWFCVPRVACELPDDSPVLREDFGPCSRSPGSGAWRRRAMWSTRSPSPSPVACSPAVPRSSSTSRSERPWATST